MLFMIENMRVHCCLLIVFFWFGGSLSLSAQQEDSKCSEAETFLSTGIRHLQEGLYASARNQIKQAWHLAASDSLLERECHYYIGASHYYEGKKFEEDMLPQKAYESYEQALSIFRQLDIPEDLAAIYRHLAELNSYAFSLHQKSLEQFRRAHAYAVTAKDSLLQIQLLADIVNELEYQESWQEKNKAVAQMGDLLRRSTNAKMVLEAEVLLGDEAVKSGRFDEAKTFYNRALEKALCDTTRKSVYWVYSKLRAMAMAQEDDEAAYQYSRHCVKAYQLLYQDNPIQQCIPFIMHAELCARTNRKEECFKSADSLFRALDYGLDEMSAAQLYMYRGMWHVVFKEYDAAVCDYEKVHEVYEKQEVKKVFSDLKSLLGLHGRALFEAGRYDEAKVQFRRFISLCQEYSGVETTEPVRVLPRLAESERLTHHIAEGAKAYEEAVRLRMKSARRDLPYMPASAREQHWKYLSETIWQMSAYALSCGFKQNDFTSKAYDALLFSKGLLLSSEKSLASEIAQLSDSSLQHTYNQLLAERNQMIEAESKGDKSAAALHFAAFNQLEREVVLGLSQRGLSNLMEEVAGKDIVHRLRKGEVVVDFTDFVNEKGEREYVAYLLSKEWKYPKLVSVTTQSQLDSLLGQVEGKIDRFYEEEYARQLLQLVWEPLKEEFSKVKTVYYVPSGFFHQIAFESIPVGRRRLLGDKYQFVRLSSAKEILHYEELRKLHQAGSAVLYGGLDYDMEAEEMAEQSARCRLPDAFALRGTQKMKGKSTFQKIDYSDEEVIAIGRILTLNNIAVRCYRGKEGTEESFLSLSGKAPHLLQLSTHGFFYTPDEAKSTIGLSGYKDMMYLTGLVMSGGNAEWTGKPLPDGVQGGLLTSADIARLDLKNVQLAVLSACETGRGKATNEGLYGLQRAFKKAGAQTLVMSLWQVSDMATKDFMVAFYGQLVKNGGDKRAAFSQARNEIRDKYQDPAYWAGFVMID